MSDPVHALYQARAYPAMSHPSTDPAIFAVTAKLAGLDVPSPSCANILEIGCAAGFNLLPLAARWPESHFTGIDLSAQAIRDARETAEQAGIRNVTFLQANLLDFDPGDSSFDFIIAHGFYSWVPDPVRKGLLDFCRAHLSAEGAAVISYNTLPGWSLRKSIVDLSRLLGSRASGQSLGKTPEDILSSLAVASGVGSPYARYLSDVLYDMMKKGEDILPFDEFGPVNDPCTFLEFTAGAVQSGLRYLGESQMKEQFPAELAPGAEEVLKPLAEDPFVLQQTIDLLTNRTFRSSVLCREDAPVQHRITNATVLHFAIRFQHQLVGDRVMDRSGHVLTELEHDFTRAFFGTLAATSPSVVPMQQVIEGMASRLPRELAPEAHLPVIARMVMDSARQNLIVLRYEPMMIEATIPERPNLGKLRLLAMAKGQPLVDQFHTPLQFPDGRRQIARLMDGSRTIEELAALSKVEVPKLDFSAWMKFLASSGVFVSGD